jgi:hypothetical protein
VVRVVQTPNEADLLDVARRVAANLGLEDLSEVAINDR